MKTHRRFDAGAAITLIDIGALDRAAAELLDGVDDLAERMPVMGRPQDELAG
jgi:hypothetical protein